VNTSSNLQISAPTVPTFTTSKKVYGTGGNKSLHFPNTAQYTGGNKAVVTNPTGDLDLTGDFTIEYYIKAEGQYYWHLMGKNTFGDNSQGWLLKKPGVDMVVAWTYVPNEFVRLSPVLFTLFTTVVPPVMVPPIAG